MSARRFFCNLTIIAAGDRCRAFDHLGIFCKEGRLTEALDIIERYGIPLSRNNAYLILQECTRRNDLECGRRVQVLMIQRHLDSIDVLGDRLVRLFSSCGCLSEANQAFHRILQPTIYTWISVISANVSSGQSKTALAFYLKMQLSSVDCNRFLYLAIVKACIQTSNLGQGRQVHYQIIGNGIAIDIILGNTLVDMYAKCGSLEESSELFNKLPQHDVVSWGAMIAGYVQHDEGSLAWDCFHSMQNGRIQPNKVIFLSVLKACSMRHAIEQGRLIHAVIIKYGLEWEVALGNALIDMYIKSSFLVESRIVFEAMPVRDVISWGVMITGYALQGAGILALDCFEKMQVENIMPDKYIFPSVLKACGSIGALEHGRFLHDQILKHGFNCNIIIGSALVDMYARCGSLEESSSIFAKLSKRDVLSWGIIISGYAQHGEGILALDYFDEMGQEGLKANEVIFLSVLKACCCIGAIAKSRLIHSQILEEEIECDLVLENTLVDTYAKIGSFEEACKVFDNLPDKSIVSWNSMIAGYSQHNKGIMAIDCYEKMQDEGLAADKVTFLSILKACGSIGAVQQGRLIHDHILNLSLHSDVSLGTSLIDMYAKCGSLKESELVFSRMPNRNVFSWSAMVAGYAQHGDGLLALSCFERMQEEGVKPDIIAFQCLLLACGRAGLIDKSNWYFEHMREQYGTMVDVDPSICMVDLLARAGALREAEDMLQVSAVSSLSGWKSLLNACRMHGNVDLGKHCFNQVLHLDPLSASGYVQMSNLCADDAKGIAKGV